MWLRCRTSEGFAIAVPMLPAIGQAGLSEYHHSLATACLVDGCRVDDGWAAENRHDWSTGAGLTATRCVFWNVTGTGVVRSRQYGWGYVIGTGKDLEVQTSINGSAGEGSAPEDFVEGRGRAGALAPPSLYEAQRARRP